MKLWLYLVAMTWVQALPTTKDFLNSSQDSTGSGRTKRYTDNIKGPLDRLKMIARITNGIYLQQGFISGTIPPEEFISEILFFGSVTPSDIVKIEHSKIQKSIDSLKDLPSALESAKPEIGKVETAFDGYSQILEGLDGVGNIDDWGKKEKVELKKDIDGLATKGITSSVLLNLGVANSNWFAYQPLVISNDQSVSEQTFADIKSGLEKLKTSVSNIDSSKPLWSFKNSGTAMDVLSTVIKTAAGAEAFLKHHLDVQLAQTDGAAYIEYMNGNSEKLKSISASRSQILTLRDLITFIESRMRTTKHTFGMPDGSSDLSTMLQNLNDPWIREVVGTDALKTVFDRFSIIENLLKETSSSLKVGGADVNRVLEFVDISSNLGISNLETTISQGPNCPAVNANILSSQLFVAFKTALEKIDEGLVKLKDQYDQLSELLKTPGLVEMCDAVIDICKQTDLPKTIEKFKKYEKRSSLDNIIKKIDDVLSLAKNNIVEIKQSATTANSKLPDFDKYHTELSHYSKYFKCLQDHKELGAAIKLIENVKKLRSFKTDPNFTSTLKNGMTEVKKVLNSKEIINKLKTELGKMKGFKSPETDALNELKDAKKHSEVIGFSVEGVSNMENVRKKREIVENVVDNLKVIEENSKVLTDPKDLEVSNRLIALKTGIQKMYKSLDDFNKNVKSTKSTVLKDHSPIFKQAKSVNGITGNFYEMSELVTKMKKMITKKEDQNKLESLKSSLNSMESMHLDFVKHHKSFVLSEDSLKSIDTFFANLRKALEKGQSQKINWLIIGTSVFIGIFGIWAIWFLVNHFLLTEWNAKRNARKNATELIKLIFDKYDLAVYKHDNQATANTHRLVAVMDLIFNNDKLNIKKPAVFEERLADYPCHSFRKHVPHSKKGAVKLEGYGDLFSDGYYHANIMRIGRKRKIIMAQPPQKACIRTITPKEDDPSKTAEKIKKKETIGKFYWMAKQYGTETIVMLCPLEKGTTDFCDRYFPKEKDNELKFKDVTVTCLSVVIKRHEEDGEPTEDDDGHRIEIRELQVEFSDSSSFTIRHILFLGWADFPVGPPDFMRLSYLECIRKMVEKDKKPVIYHCENGVDRTGCVALIECAYEMCLRGHSKKMFAKALKKVHDHRIGVIKLFDQYTLCMFVVIDMLLEKAKLEDEVLEKKFNELKDAYAPDFHVVAYARADEQTQFIRKYA
ncbi:hypothetical protein CAEBREN_01439 [Caenorhabditis brenneri]|uniref:Tyrosine-protein phosphatase domain-containing protein n=1 Tax=Caenorhabditis brenneri TaxID=135651 RepID=G0P5V7_CAEBE|nr:hypothetical protein CAEBREN_01439 [Caenorhabditis brenneri]